MFELLLRTQYIFLLYVGQNLQDKISDV